VREREVPPVETDGSGARFPSAESVQSVIESLEEHDYIKITYSYWSSNPSLGPGWKKESGFGFEPTFKDGTLCFRAGNVLERAFGSRPCHRIPGFLQMPRGHHYKSYLYIWNVEKVKGRRPAVYKETNDYPSGTGV